MLKVIIRAGGTGTRLWPLSRESQPKQLHNLISQKSMLQETISRVLGVVKPKDIFISCGQKIANEVKKQAKNILVENIIIEPDRKDTAAAIGLEAIYIKSKFPDAIIASIGSDHLIRSKSNFQKTLKNAYEMIKKHPDYLMCIAVYPTYPDTGYGYVELGKVMDEINHSEMYEVKKFTEKPDLNTAKKFLAKGNYLWNGNMFIWHVDTILDQYKKSMPVMYQGLIKIAAALNTKNKNKIIAKEYNKFIKIAVDTAIIEKAKKVAACSLEAGWSDIGDWSTLKDELSPKENLIKAHHVGLDTENTLIYGHQQKMVVTIGIENLVIVDTADALLICDKNRAQDVKKIVEKIKESKKHQYL